MRTLIVIIFTCFFGGMAFAQQPIKKVAAAVPHQVTEQFEVWGNCGMCKNAIELSARRVEGVTKANWNIKSHQFTVTFDTTKTKLDIIHKAIAESGYDTDKEYGNNEAYSNLPGCCLYKRRN